MKTAHQLVDEIALEVRPSKGVAIELHACSGSLNWVAGAPPMAVALADKFSAKIAALRKSDPIIDWSAAPRVGGGFGRFGGFRGGFGRFGGGRFGRGFGFYGGYGGCYYPYYYGCYY
jgi:hypothetical protein